MKPNKSFSEINSEWIDLCEKYREASHLYIEASYGILSNASRDSSAILKSFTELDAFKDALDAVENKMKAFRKSHGF